VNVTVFLPSVQPVVNQADNIAIVIDTSACNETNLNRTSLSLDDALELEQLFCDTAASIAGIQPVTCGISAIETGSIIVVISIEFSTTSIDFNILAAQLIVRMRQRFGVQANIPLTSPPTSIAPPTRSSTITSSSGIPASTDVPVSTNVPAIPQ
jgi:hypothetical protein